MIDDHVDAPLSPFDAEFGALATRFLDGALEPCDATRLNDCLLQSEDHCRDFMQMCLFAGIMAESLRPQLADDETASGGQPSPVAPPVVCASPPVGSTDVSFLGGAVHVTVGYFSSGWPLAYLISAVLIGGGLLVGSLFSVSHVEQIARQSAPVPASSSTDQWPLATGYFEVVARVTGMVDCKFSNQATATFPGAHVPLGRKYALAAGLMEITYDSGAKVLLQGPCTYEVEAASGGFLSLGKLTARVEKNVASGQWPAKRREKRGEGGKSQTANQTSLATGHWPLAASANPQISKSPNPLFSVRTPTAIVTDLGTEFGVEVDKSGDVTTHVFAGKVEVSTAHDKRGTIAEAGQSVQVVDRKIGFITSKNTSQGFVRTIRPAKTPGQLPLKDDFNDHSLDLTKWRMLLSCEHSKVVEQNGRMELTGRGFLITRRQYDPDALGGLKITGEWTIAGLGKKGDKLSVITRSNGERDRLGPSGGADNGLEFFAEPMGQSSLKQMHISIGPRGLSNNNNFSVRRCVRGNIISVYPGATFRFTVIDNGRSGASFTVTDVKDPTNTATTTADLDVFGKNYGNFVVFHNREYQDNVSYLDNVEIAPLSAPVQKGEAVKK